MFVYYYNYCTKIIRKYFRQRYYYKLKKIYFNNMLILLFSYIIVNQTLIPQPQTTVENKNALQMKIMELFEGQTSTQVPQVPLLGNNNEDQRQPLINNR